MDPAFLARAALAQLGPRARCPHPRSVVGAVSGARARQAMQYLNQRHAAQRPAIVVGGIVDFALDRLGIKDEVNKQTGLDWTFKNPTLKQLAEGFLVALKVSGAVASLAIPGLGTAVGASLIGAAIAADKVVAGMEAGGKIAEDAKAIYDSTKALADQGNADAQRAISLVDSVRHTRAAAGVPAGQLQPISEDAAAAYEIYTNLPKLVPQTAAQLAREAADAATRQREAAAVATKRKLLEERAAQAAADQAAKVRAAAELATHKAVIDAGIAQGTAKMAADLAAERAENALIRARLDEKHAAQAAAEATKLAAAVASGSPSTMRALAAKYRAAAAHGETLATPTSGPVLQKHLDARAGIQLALSRAEELEGTASEIERAGARETTWTLADSPPPSSGSRADVRTVAVATPADTVVDGWFVYAGGLRKGEIKGFGGWRAGSGTSGYVITKDGAIRKGSFLAA